LLVLGTFQIIAAPVPPIEKLRLLLVVFDLAAVVLLSQAMVRSPQEVTHHDSR
jgi:hypothetical protein